MSTVNPMYDHWLEAAYQQAEPLDVDDEADWESLIEHGPDGGDA